MTTRYSNQYTFLTLNKQLWFVWMVDVKVLRVETKGKSNDKPEMKLTTKHGIRW
jgi:hypothetical protein